VAGPQVSQTPAWQLAPLPSLQQGMSGPQPRAPSGAQIWPPQVPFTQFRPRQQSWSTLQARPATWQQAMVLVLARPWRAVPLTVALVYQHL